MSLQRRRESCQVKPRSIGYKQVFQWFFAPVGTSYEVKELKIALEEVFNHQQKRQKGFV